MGKETIYEKATRLVENGCVSFVCIETDDYCGPERHVYEVVGDSGTYRVTSDYYGVDCSCDARRRCSHEVAVFAFVH